MQVAACVLELAVAQVVVAFVAPVVGQVVVAFAVPVVAQVAACAFAQAAVKADIQIVAQKLFALAVHALRAEQVHELQTYRFVARVPM